MSAVALGLAFSAGMLASINPCGFAMLPSMVSFYLGLDTQEAARLSVQRRLGDGLALGALVTVGFLLVFVFAGALVWLGAGWLVRFFPWATIVVGAGLVVLGGRLYLGRGLSVWLPHREAPRVAGSSRAMVAYGIAYALASLGCTLPIFLIAVGTAVSSGPLAGLAQFVAYGLGMGVVVTTVAVSAAVFRGIVALVLRRLMPYIQQVGALLLMVAGGYVLWVDLPRVLA